MSREVRIGNGIEGLVHRVQQHVIATAFTVCLLVALLLDCGAESSYHLADCPYG